MYNEIDLWYEPRKIIIPKINAPAGEPEMSEFESAFLAGLIKKFRPRKILEIGIAAGGTSSIILQCMDMLGCDYELYSVDFSKYFYRGDGILESGFLSETAKQHVKNPKQKKYLGTIIPEVIDEIGKDIDFVLIDTTHVLPGEILDFLVVLPFLSTNAVICLHDLVCNYGANIKSKTRYKEMAFCTKVLFNSLYGEKYHVMDYTEGKSHNLSNIGAVVLNEQSREMLANVVNSLSFTWNYFPNDYQWPLYSKKIEECLIKYNCLEIWKECVNLNKAMSDLPLEDNCVFSDPKKLFNKKIVIYGAGKFGQKVYKQLVKYQKINIVSWVDKQWDKYNYDYYDVQPIEMCWDNLDYDFIVIAVSKLTLANSIKEDLVKKEIPECKILLQC